MRLGQSLVEVSALHRFIKVLLAPRWCRQEVEKEDDKRPSPGVLDTILVEGIALVCKVES